ncbi:alpha/beta fold hydrolase [Actinoplanes sp. NPDC051859]|uniref:alpha/beta fold hydrolase n=1 Tax=Actinoplanes sp. NPDC051859 TaxID=3363909 RepID=UPI0037BC4B96
MTTALLHDGSPIDVTILGTGPTVLLPVSTAVAEGEAADQMRAWGADPNLGHTLATSLTEAGFRVVAADYEDHLTQHPKPDTLTAAAVAGDLLAIADAAGAERFAYYGYSWLALSGLQLALRTDRLTGLVMGGFPPLGGPYAEMLAVTRIAHRMALAHRDGTAQVPDTAPTPGDWDSVEFTRTPEQTQQYVTLYESLVGFDEQVELHLPRLVFAGADDNISYGPKWDDAHVPIAEPIARHRAELVAGGWSVELVPGADHMRAMQAPTVLPILLPWLRQHVRAERGSVPFQG